MTTDRNIAPPAKKNVSAPALRQAQDRPPRAGSGPLFEEPAPAVGPGETLPEPPTAAPAPIDVKPPRPTTLAEAHPWLLRPFRQADVELKPGAISKDRTRALAMPFVDMRAYFSRLDKICGCENWSSTLTLTERGAVCALTIFGVTRSASGDYPIDRGDENPVTSAEAQAFKRACAAFGLGRYLYALPQIWADYDDKSRQIVNPAGIVAQMYGALPKNGDE